MIQEKVLSLLLALDGDKFCAYCPELDLATEMSTPDECIEDAIDAMRDYAEEYMENFDLYSKALIGRTTCRISRLWLPVRQTGN